MAVSKLVAAPNIASECNALKLFNAISYCNLINIPLICPSVHQMAKPVEINHHKIL